MEELGRPSLAQSREADRLPYCLVLDNIRSLNNIGSMFRTADAFRAGGLWLCGFTGQPPHREIYKTALGAEYSVPWQYRETTVQALVELKAMGYTLAAVEQTNRPTWLHEFHPEPHGKYAFVMGNEVHGVSHEALALCDLALEIPQGGVKHSVNVANAAAIVMWEMWRNASLKSKAESRK